MVCLSILQCSMLNRRSFRPPTWTNEDGSIRNLHSSCITTCHLKKAGLLSIKRGSSSFFLSEIFTAIFLIIRNLNSICIRAAILFSRLNFRFIITSCKINLIARHTLISNNVVLFTWCQFPILVASIIHSILLGYLIVARMT